MDSVFSDKYRIKKHIDAEIPSREEDSDRQTRKILPIFDIYISGIASYLLLFVHMAYGPNRFDRKARKYTDTLMAPY